jgi:DNA-binding response OmpR family regulator
MSAHPRTARILVVEDDAMSRDFVVRLLESEGHRTESAPDGPACLARLESGPPPDLVLLDVSMPGMSGLEVLAWIRARFTGEELPVVMVSALADASDVVSALDRGADDYVTKPVNPTLLIARVSAGLRRRSGVADLVAAEQTARLLEALDLVVASIQPPVRSLAERIAAVRTNPTGADTATVSTAELEELDADVQRIARVIDRVGGLAALRGQAIHAGLTAVIDATLERLGGRPGQ